MSFLRHQQIYRPMHASGTAFCAIPPSSSDESATGYSSARVAVGTSITARPPRRSVRAELPHTALPLDTSVKTHIRIRMKSAWSRNPQLEDRP